ncbi:phage major capsid protein [Neorhizobium sp. LjRoot104]|uniref:phage major capsid protein n=1 Tax=Neorhizobium sp. LjRoot104 TaxID=3342254 RepID=UPI003ECC67E8
MTKHMKIETRSAAPLETREDDPLAAATAAVEEMRAAAEERHTAHQTEVRTLTERLAAMETRLNRPGTQQQEQTDEAAATERRAFLNYLRRGNQTSEAELRALTVANDQQAGYLAPAEVSSEMIREITEFSPIRQYATVRQTTAPSVKYPKRTGITNAKWEGEIEEAEESTVTFGQTEIVAKRLTTYVDISNSLLMGSDGTAEAEVRLAFAEDFGKKESTAFVLGDGFKQPEGILTSAAVPYFANGHATNLSADALIGLMYSLPAQYRNRGVWLLNGTSLATIRKLKDGQGNFLWQPAFQAGQPETLLGRPVAEAIDMPDVAANAFPVAFGDISTAYRIVDRQALGVLSDPYTQATRAITRMHGTRWVGGGVVQPAAIKKLKMATS